MNNDLISRNEVMKLIESKFVDGCLEEGDKTLIDGYGLLDDVSDMPTAYDIKKEEASDIIFESWKEIKIIINSNINELCNQNRHSDAEYLENCRDAIKMALMMNGYKID